MNITFLSAARGGVFEALLDPDVVLRSDAAAAQVGSASELRGAEAVAGTFSGRARAAELVLIDGNPGAMWAPGGRPRVAFAFTVTGDAITGIELIADPEHLARLTLTPSP